MVSRPFGGSCLTRTKSTTIDYVKVEEHKVADEVALVIQRMECRICHEEDDVQNMESPCACSGTLKFAHRECLQQWCSAKRDTMCEICHQPYQAGYVAPPHPLHSGTSGRPTGIRNLLDLHERVHRIIVNLRLQEAELNVTNQWSTLLWQCAPPFWLIHLINRAVGNIMCPCPSFIYYMLCVLLAIGFYIACGIAGLWIFRRRRHERRRQVQEELAFFELGLTQLEGLLSDMQPTTPPEPALPPN